MDMVKNKRARSTQRVKRPASKSSHAAPKLTITYATLSTTLSDPRTLARFDRAYQQVYASLGKDYPMLINGEDRTSTEQFEKRSPINTQLLVGRFQKGTRQDARDAIAAAQAAFPVWSATPYRQRVALLRKVSRLLDQRLIDIAAWMSLEVGKSRAEAIGDVKETADLISFYCDQMEANQGFVREMAPEGTSRTQSVMKPYGVWAVVSPFNFPTALSGGPMGGALVAGNTVVLKPASDSPMSTWHLAQCFRDAGLPPGVVSYITGPGNTVGDELATNPDVAGLTFTGSYDVGYKIYKQFSQNYARPCITELGGKNPVLVSDRADLNCAAEGVVRAAFGLSGQKCSAASRVYVHRAVKERFVALLKQKTEALTVGDPTQRGVFMGPVINAAAYEKFRQVVEQARRDGAQIVTGGRTLTEGELAKGYYCAPTLVDRLPRDHPFFRDELFLPFLVIGDYDDLYDALHEANANSYALTAGFYSQDRAEIQTFLDHIEAGVVYVNREKGATTGAWPGVQPFGGWKASSSTARGGGGLYYVQQYMREQSQTLV